jgi:signal transduction histidine kinase
MTEENTKEDALFTNIVYRLDRLENRVPWAKKGFYWFSGISLGIVFFLSIVSQFVSANNIFWVDTFIHSLFESYCAIIAFIIAYVVYREYKSSGKRSNLFLFLAFFSMGTFDFFHAYSNHSVTLFVWFHSLSAFSGGAFFLWSAFSIKSDTKDPPWLRRLFIAFGIAITIVSAVMLSEYYSLLPNAVTSDISHHTPVSLPITGEFTGHLVVVNIFSALFFLSAGLFYLTYFKTTNDLLYYIFALSAFLFFESETLFVFSRLWDPSWWYWHTIKLLIYLGLAVGLAHGLTRTFSDLRESRKRLTGTVEELRHAYENLKDTQGELLDAEKLASIGKMAASIAHEIRNPLAAINNSIGIFKRHTQLVDEDRELMDIVENEIGRLNGIITDFLNYAKPSPMSRSLVDINGLLDETLLFFTGNGNNSPPLKIHKYLERNLPLVFIDRNAVKQCLWNVFINAIQAMPSGGTLTIRTQWVTKMEGDGHFDEVAIIIRDSGAGMSEETLSKAFHPFYSTKAKGTGLGLAIVQRIIKQHGGRVSLSGMVGKGTQVEITVPVNHGESVVGEGAENVINTDSR